MSDERARFLERSEGRARSESSKVSSLGKSKHDFDRLHAEPGRREPTGLVPRSTGPRRGLEAGYTFRTTHGV